MLDELIETLLVQQDNRPALPLSRQLDWKPMSLATTPPADVSARCPGRRLCESLLSTQETSEKQLERASQRVREQLADKLSNRKVSRLKNCHGSSVEGIGKR